MRRSRTHAWIRRRSYVRRTGTGTALGDPIEWRRSERVIGAATQSGRCLVGSVKANVGHCEAASNAGLVKVILAYGAAHPDAGSLRVAELRLLDAAETSPHRRRRSPGAGQSPPGRSDAFSVGGTTRA